MKNKEILEIGGKQFTIGQGLNTIDLDGKSYSVDVRRISENEYSVLINNRSFHAFFSPNGKYSLVTVNGMAFEVRKKSYRDQITEKYTSKNTGAHVVQTTIAPMPGMINKIIRGAGSMVTAGEGILVIEAMKMENELKSPKSGTIKKVHVKEHQTVEKGDSLFTIE